MAFKRLQVVSFFLVLLVVLVIVLLMVKPFAEIVAFAVILAILFNPIFSRLEARLKSATVASLITLLIIIVIVLVPIVFFGQIIFNDIVSLYGRFSNGSLVLRGDQIVPGLPLSLRQLIETITKDLNTFLTGITSNAFQTFSSLVSNVTGFLISIMVLMLTLFYLMRDGQRIKKFFTDILPIAEKQENKIIEKIVLAVNGVVKGSFLTAMTHGISGTIAFFIFGLPAPVIWGVFTVVCALVPVVGVWLAFGSTVIYLLVTGHTTAAIGLAIWAVVSEVLIDNVIGPRLVGKRAKLHPLLVLLSVLGGIKMFGPLGFLIGPITMAIFVTLVDIYRQDFKASVEQ